jgi:3-phosphoshikimate 1-carboxyvinyltransferase
MELYPIKSINGDIHIPCSKSEAQRALLIGAIQKRPLTLIMVEPSEDVFAVIQLLKKLGFGIEWNNNNLVLHAFPSKLDKVEINVNESGFAFRALASVAMHWTEELFLTGEKSLIQRDFSELQYQLIALGLHVKSNEGKLPFLISGQLRKGEFLISSKDSSQGISGILIALAALADESKVTLENVVSLPYVELTVRMLQNFGFGIKQEGLVFSIYRDKLHALMTYQVNGDWSSAAVWFAAAALKGEIRLRGLALNTFQSDEVILEIIQHAGAEVIFEKDGIIVRKSQKSLRPIYVDLLHCPDLFPVLAIFSCGISGISKFTSLHRLTNKESNRLMAVCTMLDAFQVNYIIENNSMSIIGRETLKGAKLEVFGDHRLIMAATLASCVAEDVVYFDNEEAVAKSYPSFFTHWNSVTER